MVLVQVVFLKRIIFVILVTRVTESTLRMTGVKRCRGHVMDHGNQTDHV
jgi:hypothetical protein